jgi:uncharacterized protein involved in outer membrane biogenesis
VVAQLRVRPLFNGSIEVSDITLDGLVLHLDKKGTVDSAKDKISADKKTVSNQTKKSKTPSKSTMRFTIENISVNDAKVTWTDETEGAYSEVSALNLRVKNFNSKDDFPVHLSFVAMSSEPSLKAKISLDTKVTVDFDKSQASFKAVNLTGVVKGKATNNRAIDLRLKGDININFEKRMYELKGAELQYGEVYATELTTTLVAKNRTLLFSPISANVFQGNVNAQLRINYTLAQPSIAFQAVLKKMQAQPLLSAVASYKKIRGKLDGAVQLGAHGSSAKALLSTLIGRVRVRLDDGVLQGVNVRYLINSAKALAKKEAPPKRESPNQTAFGTLTATAKIINGVAYNDDLLLWAPEYQIEGKGKINLASEQIDYELSSPQVEIKDMRLPILVTGDLNDPSVRLNAKEALKSLLKENVKKIQEQVKEKVKTKVKDKAADLFKSLIN